MLGVEETCVAGRTPSPVGRAAFILDVALYISPTSYNCELPPKRWRTTVWSPRCPGTLALDRHSLCTTSSMYILCTCICVRDCVHYMYHMNNSTCSKQCTWKFKRHIFHSQFQPREATQCVVRHTSNIIPVHDAEPLIRPCSLDN